MLWLFFVSYFSQILLQYFVCKLLVPGPSANLTITEVTLEKVNITWEAPSEPNGVIIEYLVTYYPHDGMWLTLTYIWWLHMWRDCLLEVFIMYYNLSCEGNLSY